MNDDEFEQTPVAQAMRAYTGYMGELMQFTQHHRASSGVVFTLVNSIAKAANVNQVDSEQHKPIFHALIIIGAWSALEAYVTDFCKCVIRGQSDVLEESREVRALKVPLTDLLAGDADKTDRVYEALEKNFGHGQGVGQFESLLKHLKLDGFVPEDIRRAILLAQKVRNVWAHNAGRADAKFIPNSSPLEFKLGDKVAISVEDTYYYISTLFMYGSIITSRWRLQNGLNYLPVPDQAPMKASYDSIWERPEYTQ